MNPEEKSLRRNDATAAKLLPRPEHFPLQRFRGRCIQALAHQHGIALLLDQHRAFFGSPCVPASERARFGIVRRRRLGRRNTPHFLRLFITLLQRLRINLRELRRLLCARPARDIHQPQRRWPWEARHSNTRLATPDTSAPTVSSRRTVRSAPPHRTRPSRQYRTSYSP